MALTWLFFLETTVFDGNLICRITCQEKVLGSFCFIKVVCIDPKCPEGWYVKWNESLVGNLCLGHGNVDKIYCGALSCCAEKTFIARACE
jgi:hypothetical protein